MLEIVYRGIDAAWFSHHISTCHLIQVNCLKERKNVLFLLSDDLRPELNCFGAKHIHSPAIDSLAARSLVLRRNYVQQVAKKTL